MATVSEQLRRAREQQQLDVYQVAEITKIKTDHIRALESGSFDVFPAPVYIRGFVRTYAMMLKLDVRQLLTDLDGELGQSEKFRDPPPLTNTPRGALDFVMLQLSRLNWRIAFGIAAVVVFLILAFAVIRSRSSKPSDPLKNLAPGVHQQKPNKSGETLPVPAPPPRNK
jgi:cytoskeletal protein RodZ